MPAGPEDASITIDDRQCATALVHNMPDAVVHADKDGAIGCGNAPAARIPGFTAAALGQSLDIIIPADLRERHWDGARATMRTGRSRGGAGDLLALPAMRKDGTRLSVDFTVVPGRRDAVQRAANAASRTCRARRSRAA